MLSVPDLGESPGTKYIISHQMCGELFISRRTAILPTYYEYLPVIQDD